jgi:hypothetical protein
MGDTNNESPTVHVQQEQAQSTTPGVKTGVKAGADDPIVIDDGG